MSVLALKSPGDPGSQGLFTEVLRTGLSQAPGLLRPQPAIQSWTYEPVWGAATATLTPKGLVAPNNRGHLNKWPLATPLYGAHARS
jgi:hypothetical protein